MGVASLDATTHSSNYKKLRDLLEELFQLDQADLDFGIYRIMNQKRDEILRFLDHDLLPQVKEAFKEYHSADRSAIQKELDEVTQAVVNAGMNPDDSPRVRELRAKLAESAVDVIALENEVFSHLTNFFRRYYHEGDFISQRRYKEGVYAIPYEGEEVKLHWANADQYYVKTSEYLRDYCFVLPSGRRVRFKLVSGNDLQRNLSPKDARERCFILSADKSIIEEGDELQIRFEFRKPTLIDWNGRRVAVEAKKGGGLPSQSDLNEQAVSTILSAIIDASWIEELGLLTPTEQRAERTLLEKHLAQYTVRNASDYFIHKDLGGFLRRELDFYVKNEVMFLDDIENEDAPRAEQYLALIRVIRSIAQKIIAFLEQLENFQKRLWLKKKFVVETNYCITLDRIPREFYPEIAANESQRVEWVENHSINEIKPDMVTPGYSVPLTEEFLAAHSNLVVDTRHFDNDFKIRLISSMSDLDEEIDGILVRGDNFQGLSLLQKRFFGHVRTIYIDPPFNLGSNADFLYRTDYKDSTWLTMLYDRLTLASKFLSENGHIYVRCDVNGNYLVRHLLDMIFGKNNFRAELLVQRVRKNVTEQGRISLPLANDSLFLYSKTDLAELVNPFLKLEKAREAYWRRIDDSSGYRNPPERVIFGFTFLPYKRDAHFKFSQATINRMIDEGRVRIRCRDCGYIHYIGTWKSCPACGSTNAVPQYLVEENDRKVLDTNWMDISGYSHTTGFPTENAEVLLRRVIEVTSEPQDWILDFFAGSGTTQIAALATQRRWVGIELGDQFDLFIIPRLKKWYYSNDRSGYFKYMRLESYEDTLNNLGLSRTDDQLKLLESEDEMREQYMLSYMLDNESRRSQSLVNIDGFRNPDEYKLKVERNGETQLVNVDLVETFNWLLGLEVKHIDKIRGVRVVDGTNPDGERVLVLWRNVDEMDNDKLDDWFQKQGYNTRDFEYDLIYVNGDNNLENLRRPDQTWKVRLIEEEFHRLMFDVQDV